jgi:hypothetical protein
MFRANGTADAGRMPAQGKAGKAVEQAAILPFACTRCAYHFQPPQHILSGLGSCTKVVFSLRTQQELYRRLCVVVRRRVSVSTATSLPSPYALTSLSPLSALSSDNCDTSFLKCAHLHICAPACTFQPASASQADELGMDLRRKEPWARVGCNPDIRKDLWCVPSNVGAAACWWMRSALVNDAFYGLNIGQDAVRGRR